VILVSNIGGNYRFVKINIEPYKQMIHFNFDKLFAYKYKYGVINFNL